MAKKSNFITQEKFYSLKSGDNIVIRYMTGTAVVDSPPFRKGGNDCFKVKFKDGPFKGKPIRIIRQQVASKSWGLKPFPPKKK